MDTTDVPLEVAPVKYTLALKLNTSTLLAFITMVDPTMVVFAIALAALAVSPKPI
jgi:hypothetical protein